MVVGAKIVTGNELLAVGIVVFLSVSRKLAVSPVNRSVIYVSTAITNLVALVEICVGNTSMYLDFLSGGHLGLHL